MLEGRTRKDGSNVSGVLERLDTDGTRDTEPSIIFAPHICSIAGTVGRKNKGIKGGGGIKPRHLVSSLFHVKSKAERDHLRDVNQKLVGWPSRVFLQLEPEKPLDTFPVDARERKIIYHLVQKIAFWAWTQKILTLPDIDCRCLFFLVKNEATRQYLSEASDVEPIENWSGSNQGCFYYTNPENREILSRFLRSGKKINLFHCSPL